MTLFFVLLGALGCVADAPSNCNKVIADLSPCPNSPNCISSRSSEPRHAMPPLPYLKSGRESLDRLIRIVRGMKRAKIVSATSSYLHVEFRSPLLRFVDDVEFVLDDSTRVIHFRSASRTGWYDFGVNRRRMKQISDHYLRRTQDKD